ncbi:MazG nucleotide pyrophosphohydrolase domain-containing protein [Romboutsia sp. 1001285H_161024_C4]|uniref:MazG nucleotide pyrophosphohydrolase domain-containing protein n=1 Tax=Romboutsia sp. 1001285H_161024_C4 TaxID=2787109 RepID=UPI001896F4B3|nr:MazG nucleotide pyrophosphohydrolase domain-containing protein [Romboutsia sp. 1001285H_161024_C4]
MYKHYMDAIKVDKDLCSLITMEECSELTKAVSKAKRGKLDKDNMAEEIADVLIGINWIKKIYGITNEEIDIWKKMKSNRVVDRLNSNEFK